MPIAGKIHTPASALMRARKYCAYQERSQQEVRDKLYELGLHRNDVEQAISQLITEGFLNEQRFAIAFAGGKFRVMKWGKVKIRMALKAKQVSENCIKAALKQIPEVDYLKTLEKVISDRKKKMPKDDSDKMAFRLAHYAISRGYEPDLVWNTLKMN